MSGIFGLIRNEGDPVCFDHLEQMKQALIHHGPDGARIWRDGSAGLGHLATCITPESDGEGEILPHVSEDHLVITADARIDNRDELFDRLGIHGTERKEIPDSQLILRSYRVWGAACPGHLTGEFAFAIWDRKKKQLFCARDHMGFRPLFYRQAPGWFVFASEINAIRHLPFVSKELEERALARALIRAPGLFPSDLTFFKGILELRLGCRMLITAKSTVSDPRIDGYWNPLEAKATAGKSSAQSAEILRGLVIEATACRLRKRPGIQVGITLSGGLDSSAIACIAARKLHAQGEPLVSLSSVLPLNHQGVEKDERLYIQAVLDQEPNISPHFVTAQGVSPLANLEQFFDQTGMPVNYYNYMDHALRKKAHDQGVRLLLCGLGGDHMASYSGKDTFDRLVSEFRWITAAKLGLEISKADQTSPVRTLAKVFSKPLRGYLKGSVNPNPMDFSLVKPEFLTRIGITPEMVRDESRLGKMSHASKILEKIRGGKFGIGLENIRNAHLGLTGLYPFFDKRIVEFFCTVPAEHFMAGGHSRGLFRLAMEGILPSSIQWRTNKQPYSPDFHQRLIDARQDILNLLQTLGPQDPLRETMDMEKIRAQAERLRPATGRSDWDSQAMSVVFNGIMLARYLLWFEKQ